MRLRNEVIGRKYHVAEEDGMELWQGRFMVPVHL